jgi:hypothetical protein
VSIVGYQGSVQVGSVTGRVLLTLPVGLLQQAGAANGTVVVNATLVLAPGAVSLTTASPSVRVWGDAPTRGTLREVSTAGARPGMYLCRPRVGPGRGGQPPPVPSREPGACGHPTECQRFRGQCLW